MNPSTKDRFWMSYLVALAMLVASCKAQEESFSLRTGAWRGEFTLGDRQVPFNFTVTENAVRPQVILVNGGERALLDSVYYRGDSLVIPIELYDAILVGRVQGDSLRGYF